MHLCVVRVSKNHEVNSAQQCWTANSIFGECINFINATFTFVVDLYIWKPTAPATGRLTLYIYIYIFVYGVDLLFSTLSRGTFVCILV